MPILLERCTTLLRIDEDTIARLRDFSSVVEPSIDDIIHVFYSRLTASDAASLFTSPESLARASQAQKKHWMTYVLCGRFDSEYMAAARSIGHTHYRLGVDLMVYSSAYSVLLNELTVLISTFHRDRPDIAQSTHYAVQQAIFLDMALAISVYYESMIWALEEMSNELNFSLARAGEFRDNETGMHLMRMSRMCAGLAAAIGKDRKWVQTILIASPLHDVGKIGIPDNESEFARRLPARRLG